MNLFYSVKSDYNFDMTMRILRNGLTQKKFTVLAEFNLAQKLQANNLPYEDELLVLEVCNPTYAFSVLSTKPKSKYLLPCRITVTGSDVVSVGMLNYNDFSSLGYHLSKSESYVLNEIKDILNQVVNKKVS
ncbi:MAG: DUF302 domain-containing protein [Candidatus Izemoplasmataceae bacterium]